MNDSGTNGTNGTNGSNGSGNGHDDDEADIIHFPSLAERDRIRREKEEAEAAEEKAIRAAYKQRQKDNAQPFFNAGKIPVVTRFLFVAILIIHVVKSLILSDTQAYQLITLAGFTPGLFTGEEPWQWNALITPISYMFLHSDWMHIGFNSVMLLALGVFFEREFGAKNMILFFLACGILGAVFYLLINPFSVIPVIGASGAVSGLFGVVLLILHERGMMGTMGKYGPWPLIVIWMLMIVGFGMIGGGNVAWQAHLGGFLGGLLLLYLWRRGLIKL